MGLRELTLMSVVDGGNGGQGEDSDLRMPGTEDRCMAYRRQFVKSS